MGSVQGKQAQIRPTAGSAVLQTVKDKIFSVWDNIESAIDKWKSLVESQRDVLCKVSGFRVRVARAILTPTALCKYS